MIMDKCFVATQTKVTSLPSDDLHPTWKKNKLLFSFTGGMERVRQKALTSSFG